MARLTLRARGPADVATAWERYAQFGKWPSWSPQISSVDASAERIAAGVTGTVAGPMWAAADFEIDAVDEDARTWSWTVRRKPLTVRLEHGVEHDNGGSSTWLTIDGPMPFVVPYAPIAQAALRRLVAR
jgi:hypothetical protein